MLATPPLSLEPHTEQPLAHKTSLWRLTRLTRLTFEKFNLAAWLREFPLTALPALRALSFEQCYLPDPSAPHPRIYPAGLQSLCIGRDGAPSATSQTSPGG